MMNLLGILKTVSRRARLEILTVLMMIFVYIWALLLTPFTLLFLLYKQLVILVASLLRPDLSHILSDGNSWVALESINTRAKANVIICLVLDAPFQMEKSIRLFQKNVMEKRRTDGCKDGSGSSLQGQGPLIYPELKQVYTEFGGYFFWKDESNFNIKDHVRVFDYDDDRDEDSFKSANKVVTEPELRELSTRLLSKPWKPDFSPWEILCIPQYQGQSQPQDKNAKNTDHDNTKLQSVLIIRFHHVMGDGKGWLTLLLEDVIQMKDTKMATPTVAARSFWNVLFSPIKIPYDFAKNQVESVASEGFNPWHTLDKRSKEYYTSFTPSMSSQYVKDIKNKFGVGYNAVLISAISGGIRRVMEKVGQPVPEKMVGAVAVPLPNHPGGICIHAALMCLSWPVGIADAKSRLQVVNKELKAHKSSLAPLGQKLFFVKLFAIYPNFVRRAMYNKNVTSLGVSLFPGPIETPEIYGAKVIDSFLLLGLPAGQCGVGVWTLVVGGRGRVVVNIDKKLFPCKTEFEKLGDYIFDELATLHEISAEGFKFPSKINRKLCKENIV